MKLKLEVAVIVVVAVVETKVGMVLTSLRRKEVTTHDSLFSVVT